MPKYLMSACLAGENVRYDGRHCLQEQLKKLVENGDAIMVCPETMGGLATPRLPAEIVGGSAEDVLNGKAEVLDSKANNLTQTFINGAYKVLKIAQSNQITHVILKENSPSCGSHFIYDGTFKAQKIRGMGITATLLKQHGFIVLSEDDFLETLK